ncbi:YbaB/EbfC family nucleoid-associated protein [Saccharomonospora sp. NPDC046836]|uniref:YbaB/EbfC family nucleoid-associated protein n=1 Tax=Saccharomonospora sp. NPDC046836 TaxID=3156921 RepID=UPI0033E52069
MSETAKRLVRRIEAIDTAAADNRARAETYQRMTEELSDVTGTATSPDGVVTVVAGPDGAVKRVTFSDQVRAVQPTALSTSVEQTIAQARVAATTAQAEVVRRAMGDTDLLDRVLAEDARMFGDQRPVAVSPARPQRTDDDDFEDFRVLGR